mmetsp:Transcript_50639/g.94330  ORF Transcript_50639/g.94330 Transcript_50639/m.94330 type:complete len:725 (+) Transcript_50639:355-2529(+)
MLMPLQSVCSHAKVSLLLMLASTSFKQLSAQNDSIDSPTTAPTVTSIFNSSAPPTRTPTTSSPNNTASPTSSPTASLADSLPSTNLYSINWDQVDMNTVRKVDVVQTCLCDMTMDACDVNCCCDPDCEDQDREYFASNPDGSLACLAESPPAPELQFCSSESMRPVALPSSGSLAVVFAKKADELFISRSLCIVRDNNPELGRFFLDPVDGGDAALDTALEQNAASFLTPQEYESSSQYQAGNPIRVRYNTSAGWRMSTLRLPAGAWSGVCSESATQVVFGQNVPAAAEASHLSCLVPTTNLQADCARLFSGSSIHQLQVGEYVTSSIFHGVNVTSIEYVHWNGASQTLLANATVPTPTYDAATGECRDALHTLEYTLMYRSDRIVEAKASVKLTTAIRTRALEQHYQVRFVKEGEEGAARPTSGRPGYYPNFPLLAGLLEEEPVTLKQAIGRLVDGLPIPVARSDGRCGVNSLSPVRFGMNTAHRCSVPLTKSGLEQFCEGRATTTYNVYINLVTNGASLEADTAPTGVFFPISVQLLGGLFHEGGEVVSAGLSGRRVYVASWADERAENKAGWAEMGAPQLSEPEAMTWDPATSTCNNVVAGLAYEFLTARVGPVENPQHKVVDWRIKYVYGYWRFMDQRGALVDPFKMQEFWLNHTVQFVPMDQPGPKGVMPPAPPLFPKLSQDLFYPFSTSNAHGKPPSFIVLIFVCLVVSSTFVASRVT